MSRSGVFWGLVLIGIGSLFLLDNLGIIQVEFWKIVGPLFLILFGFWILVGPILTRGQSEKASVGLAGASHAKIRINYGAGELRMSDGAFTDPLLEGEFGGGVDKSERLSNGGKDVVLSLPSSVWPGFWFAGKNTWKIFLNPQVPLRLELKVGAAESILDFSNVIVNELDLQTGASATKLTLPTKAGICRVKISAGMAEVNIHIPEQVAARIRSTAGLGTTDVDQSRFPRQGSEYKSPDFDTAENKVDLFVEIGLGAVNIY